MRYHLARSDADLDALDGTQQERLGQMLAENDPSAAATLRRIDDEALDVVLRRVDDIEDDHTIRDFKTADEANDQFIEERRDTSDDDPRGPHADNSIVLEYETDQQQTVYRLWDSDNHDSNMGGEFTTPSDVVADADPFTDLTNRLVAPSQLERINLHRRSGVRGCETAV